MTVKGPKGTLAHTVAAPITVDRRRRRRPRGQASRRRARSASSLHGLTRTLINNMVVGVTEGYEKKLEIVGVGYRVLSKGPTQLEFQLGYSPPDHRSTPPRASPSRSRARPSSASRASTSSWSARSRPTSASCASPSPTRARACATPASTSAARSERLVSDHGDLAQAQQAHRGDASASRLRRQVRGRKKIAGTAERPRLVVTRSSKHIIGQVVDDLVGQDAGLRLHHGGRPARASTATRPPRPSKVGELVAERAKAAGIDDVVFDRAGNKYHGRIAALADGAREGGLTF